MHFHKLEEFLRSGEGAAFTKATGIDPMAVADSIRQSVKFCAGDTHLVPEGELVSFGRLPFPICAFEFRDLSRRVSKRLIMLAREIAGGGAVVQIFEEARGSDGWPAWCSGGFGIVKNPDLSDFRVEVCVPKEMETDAQTVGVLARTIARQCHLLGKLLEVLNISNVKTVLISPSEKLNARRLARGRKPLYSFHTLVCNVGGEAKEILRGEAGGGAEGMVRVHLVRGHIKRRRTGLFWWQPHARGNPRLGVVMKDYALEIEE